MFRRLLELHLEKLLGNKEADVSKKKEGHLKYFKSALEETLPSKNKEWENKLKDQDKQVIMDNCMFSLAKAIMRSDATYLLLFSEHHVMIGK
jgi:hypothetical protein